MNRNTLTPFGFHLRKKKKPLLFCLFAEFYFILGHPPEEKKKPLLFLRLWNFAIRICCSERVRAQCERNSTSAPLNDASLPNGCKQHWKHGCGFFCFRFYRVQVSMAARWVANIIERRACWVAFALGAHSFRKADADGKGWQTKKQKWLFFLPQVEPEGGKNFIA